MKIKNVYVELENKQSPHIKQIVKVPKNYSVSIKLKSKSKK